jgi:hypothetical protein
MNSLHPVQITVLFYEDFIAFTGENTAWQQEGTGLNHTTQHSFSLTVWPR